MQAYGDMISDDTTLVLTTDSDLFRFLRGMQVEADPVGDPPAVPGDGGIASTHKDQPQTETVAPIVARTDDEPGQ
jgi:membrane protease subunit HflC